MEMFEEARMTVFCFDAEDVISTSKDIIEIEVNESLPEGEYEAD